MKKYLFFLLILIFSMSTAYAGSNNVIAPQWSEFCPANFCDAHVWTKDEIEDLARKKALAQTDVFYCKYHGVTAKIIRGITILPAADCWCAKKIATYSWRNQLSIQNDSNAYWVQRKKDFYTSLKTCNGLSKDMQAMCYLKVREIELQKTSYRKQEIYNQTVINQNAARNIQLQNINNNLNTINSNL